MAERKAIPKKVRFEVLKRDKFTCQYCGREAPDVVLNIDHIKPVSKGGTNDITNLITSCWDCNSGKSNRELSDDTAVKKQKAQLDMLQERREQLEMMRDWQMQLTNDYMSEVDIVSEIVERISGCGLDGEERRKIRKLIDQFGTSDVCDGIRTAFAKYDSRYEAMARVGGICYCSTHTTCYDCLFYMGRYDYKPWMHTCRKRTDKDGEFVPFKSIKEAESCETFSDKEQPAQQEKIEAETIDFKRYHIVPESRRFHL